MNNKRMNEQPVTTSKRLVHNTLFNVVTLVCNAFIGFFLIRFFLGQLGEARYGIWLLVGGSIFRYAPMLSMGLNSSINRYVPMYLAKNNEEGLQRVINTSLLYYSSVAVVFAMVSLGIYYNVGSWFAIKSELIPTAESLVLVVGCCFALATPLQLSSGLLSGLQRYDIINLILIVTLLLRTTVVVVLLSYGFGLLTMGLAFGLSEILMRVLQFFFAKKLLPQMSLSFGKVDFKLMRQMLAFGINTFLYGMGALIIYNASNVVIGIFIGTEEISQFATAAAGILLLSQLLGAFSRAIMPAVSYLDAKDEQKHVREISFLTQKYGLLLIIPASCFLIVMGREFLWIWVGNKFEDPTIIDGMAAILAILAVGHCIRLAQHSNFLVLVGRGQHRIFGVLTALMALICVLASIVTVKVFNWGLLGIAWSNFLPMALISGAILPIYFNWKMRISVLESVRRVWQPAVLGSLPAVIMISIWKYLAPPASWVEIFAVVVAAMLLTLGSSWLFSLGTIERNRFLSLLARR